MLTPTCAVFDINCWWRRVMHANTTNEIAVGSCSMLMAIIAVDDPMRLWIDQNWLTLVVVIGATMVIASVTCILSPAETKRQTVGRILASGIFGAVVAVISGSMSIVGSPTRLAGIVLICGIGGWMGWLLILEYLNTARNSPQIKGLLASVLRNWVLRMAKAPLDPTQPVIALPPVAPLTPEQVAATRIPEKHLPEPVNISDFSRRETRPNNDTEGRGTFPSENGNGQSQPLERRDPQQRPQPP